MTNRTLENWRTREGSFTTRGNGGSELSLSEKQIRQLPGALLEAIYGLERDEPAGLIAEIDREVRESMPSNAKFPSGGICLPLGLLQRSLVSNVFTQGGAFVGTDVGEIEPALRPPSVVMRAGARLLTGLKGDLSLPIETSATTISWLHQLETVSPTDSVFGALALTPHRASGATSLDRQLDKQTAGTCLQFVIESLMAGVASALDTAALVGNGSLGQPLGLYSAAGVGTVTFAGAATLAKAADFEAQITTLDGDDQAISFVAHPAVRKKWKQLQRWTGASLPLWGNANDEERILGKPAFVTSAMANTDICAGQFDKLIVAFWGDGAPVQVLVDEFSQSLNSRISLVVSAYADTGILRPNLFVKNADSSVA